MKRRAKHAAVSKLKTRVAKPKRRGNYYETKPGKKLYVHDFGECVTVFRR